MKPHNLIPKHKGDIETACKLINYAYKDTKTIVPELLKYIQDLHWPIAGIVGEYLETISENITSQIIEILNGKDEEWKSSCIVVFGIRSTKPIDFRLKTKIEKIALNPTEGEIYENTHITAKEFLNIK